METKPSDIERAACTLIMLHCGDESIKNSHWDVLDEVVRTWALDVAYGRVNSILDNRDIHNHHTKTASYDYKGFNYEEVTEPNLQHYYQIMNDAITHLAHMVLCYREKGEGDHTTTIDRMSEFTITTSLAAAVVEFHYSVMHAIHVMYDERHNKICG